MERGGSQAEVSIEVGIHRKMVLGEKEKMEDCRRRRRRSKMRKRRREDMKKAK